MFDYIKLRKKYNTLENKYETLKSAVEDDLFKKMMDKLCSPVEIERLRLENKNLRTKLKESKEELKKWQQPQKRKKSI